MLLEEKLRLEEERINIIRYYATLYDLNINKSRTILFSYIMMSHAIDIGLWDYFEWKRQMSRIPYNNGGNIDTGFISVEALNIKIDPTKNNSKHLTWDHLYSPQTYSHYMYGNWYELYKDNLINFYKDMKMLMEVIRVTKTENTNLSKYTVNDKFTNHQLKLIVPTIYRYTEAGITLLGNNISPRTIRSEDIPDRFPFGLSKHFKEWEAKHLLVS